MDRRGSSVDAGLFIRRPVRRYGRTIRADGVSPAVSGLSAAQGRDDHILDARDDPSWYATLGPSANYLNMFVFSSFPSMSNVSDQSVNNAWQYYRNAYRAYTGKPLSVVGSFGIDSAYLAAAGLQLVGGTNSSALVSALESLKVSQIPWPLVNQYTPFEPGDTIFGPQSSGAFWHSTNQTIAFMQVHYNPSTQSVYT